MTTQSRFILGKYRLALSSTGQFYTLNLIGQDNSLAEVLIPARDLPNFLKTLERQAGEVRTQFEAAQAKKS